MFLTPCYDHECRHFRTTGQKNYLEVVSMQYAEKIPNGQFWNLQFHVICPTSSYTIIKKGEQQDYIWWHKFVTEEMATMRTNSSKGSQSRPTSREAATMTLGSEDRIMTWCSTLNIYKVCYILQCANSAVSFLLLLH